MSKVICIAGESGSGKTTSMRNLDPKTTLYIDCDKKGLSWKGWRSQYNSENQNYIKTDFAQVVQQTLQKVDKVEKWKHIKVVVIDTINGLMVSDEMRRSKEKGYDKWVDLTAHILPFHLCKCHHLTVAIYKLRNLYSFSLSLSLFYPFSFLSPPGKNCTALRTMYVLPYLFFALPHAKPLQKYISVPLFVFT